MNFKTIDLYWVHSWDTLTPIEEVMHTLNAAVERGQSVASASAIAQRGLPRHICDSRKVSGTCMVSR
jgi:aryl-alcohol dehydrogenase-like predicted oxidoreductase